MSVVYVLCFVMFELVMMMCEGVCFYVFVGRFFVEGDLFD